MSSKGLDVKKFRARNALFKKLKVARKLGKIPSKTSTQRSLPSKKFVSYPRHAKKYKSKTLPAWRAFTLLNKAGKIKITKSCGCGKKIK